MLIVKYLALIFLQKLTKGKYYFAYIFIFLYLISDYV